MDPIEVTDRKSFIELVEFLKGDVKNNTVGMNKRAIEDFLESIAAYANDIQGYYDNRHQQINADKPSWRVFADILKGATMYE